MRQALGTQAQPEDRGYVVFGERLESAERVAVQVERLDEKGNVLLFRAQLREGEREAEGLEPFAERRDAGKRGIGIGLEAVQKLRDGMSIRNWPFSHRDVAT